MTCERIANFNASSNPSPRGGGDAIHQVVIGYEFEQTGWVCIVFDMRPNATLDGEWTQVIDETKIDFKHWAEAFWDADDEPFDVIFPDGYTESSQNIECDEFSNAIGESLRDLLTELVQNDGKTPLPLSMQCTFAIEDFNGHFGWTSDGDNTAGND